MTTTYAMYDLTEVTPEQAFAAMEAAVQERGPDFRYADGYPKNMGCMYVVDGAPACLVGNALHRLGVSLDTLFAIEGVGAGNLNRSVLPDNLNERFDFCYIANPVRVNDQVAEMFDVAQVEQDRGASWGDALDAVRRIFGSNGSGS